MVTLNGNLVFHFKAKVEFTRGSFLFGQQQKIIFSENSFWMIDAQLVPNIPENATLTLRELTTGSKQQISLATLGLLLLIDNSQVILMTRKNATELSRKTKPVNV